MTTWHRPFPPLHSSLQTKLRAMRGSRYQLPTLERLEIRSLLSAAIQVTGNATAIASGDVTPSVTDFTDFRYASTTANATIGRVQRTFFINNSGNSALSLTGVGPVTLSGANAADFSVISEPTASVGAGASIPFTISFTPHATGVKTAIVTVNTNDPAHRTFTFEIQGTGVATTTSGTGLMSGDLQAGNGSIVGLSSLNVSYSVATTQGVGFEAGVTPATVDSNGVVGGGFITGFLEGLQGIQLGEKRVLIMPASLAYGTSSHGAIPANANLVFTVEASGPKAAISGNGQLITSGDVTPTVSDFTDFGNASTTVDPAIGPVQRTFTINNSGNSALTISGPVISGANAADFSVSTAPAATLVAGGSTPFVINFTPHAAGVSTAMLTVQTNDPLNPTISFEIQGTGFVTTTSGTGLQSTQLHPGSGTLAGQGTVNIAYTVTTTTGVGTESGVVSATIASNGSITSVGLIAGFVEGLQGILPGETRLLILPPALGYGQNVHSAIPANSSLIFTVNAFTSPMTVTGNGVAITNHDTTPSVTDFTDFNSQSITQDATLGTLHHLFVINNSGNSAVTLTGATPVTITGPNAADFTLVAEPTGSVVLGAPANFTINFVPHGTGLRKATVTIQTNDPTNPVFTFAIQGTGVKTTNSTSSHLQVASTGLINIHQSNSFIGHAAMLLDIQGYKSDGTVFLDTHNLPLNSVSLQVNGTTGNTTGLIISNGTSTGQALVSGLVQGLQGLKIGESRYIAVPAALDVAFDANNPPPSGIPLNTTVYFKVTARPPTLVIAEHQTGNFNLIPFNESPASTVDTTQLGTLVHGATVNFLSALFEIANVGNGRLTFDPIVHITGPGAHSFIASTIGTANGFFGFTMFYVPTKPGSDSAVAHVKTNFPAHPDFTFAIGGANVPVVDLRPTVGKINFPAHGPIVSGVSTQYKIPITITNTGNSTIPTNSAPVPIQVFAHNTSTGTDTLLSSASLTTTALRGLGAHQSRTISDTETLPAGLAGGPYVIKVVVDNTDVLFENSTTNNAATSSAFTVTQGLNGVTGSLGASTFPATLGASASLGGSMTFVLANTGTLPLPAGQQFSVQLVAINTTSQVATPIGAPTTVTISNLAVGATTPVETVSGTAAGGLPTGNYNLGAILTPVTALSGVSTVSLTVNAAHAAIPLAIT